MKRYVILMLAGLAAGCGGPTKPSAVEFRVPVKVKEVTTGPVEDRVVATGALRASESATLAVETTGSLKIARIGNRRLGEGDVVRAGQVVATVAGEEVDLAARTEANLRRFEQAKRDLDSKQSLFKEGLITELELKAAQTTLADAEAELQRSRLTEARSQLISPIGGVILKLARGTDGLPLPDGQRVVAGASIAQIGPIGTLIADVDLIGPDAARIAPGLPVRLRQHAWEEKRFEGRVSRLAPTLDTQTRAVRAEVEVDNPEGFLRPGMFIEATVIVERRERVLLVPRDAVTERNGRKVAFVLDGQRVIRKEVVPGLGDDEMVEIREGLKEGDRVVVQGLETLADGTGVRVLGN